MQIMQWFIGEQTPLDQTETKIIVRRPSVSWSNAIPMIEYGYNASRNKSESAFKKLFKREPSEAAKYQFLRQLVALDTKTRRAHTMAMKQNGSNDTKRRKGGLLKH
eukprot:984042_1